MQPRKRELRKKPKQKNNLDDFISKEFDKISKSRKPKPLKKATDSKETPKPVPLKKMMRFQEETQKKPPAAKVSDEEIYEEDFEDISEEETPKAESNPYSMEEIKKALAEENAKALEKEKEEERSPSPQIEFATKSSFQVNISSKTLQLQERRNKDLLEIIELEKETFNLFELLPLSEHDAMMESISKGNLQHSSVQSNADNNETEMQTEDVETKDAEAQWPGEMVLKEEKPINQNFVNKFLRRVLPVVETLLEENVSNKTTKLSLNRDKSSGGIASQFSIGSSELFSELFSENGEVTNLLFFPGKKNYLVAVYKLTSKSSVLILWDVQNPRRPSRVLFSEGEVSCVIVPSNSEHILIAGTQQGSLLLFDLRESASFHPSVKVNNQKYTLRRPTYSSEAVVEGHLAPVVQIQQVSGNSVISLDNEGNLVAWSYVELGSADLSGSEIDLGLRVGGRAKLVKSNSLSLFSCYNRKPSLVKCFAVSPYDHNTIIMSSGTKLYKSSRFGEKVAPEKYKIASQVSWISWGADPYFILGEDCGSISVYDKDYSGPVSNWIQVGSSVRKIEWASNSKPGFYCIDCKGLVSIWDLKVQTASPVAKVDLSIRTEVVDWVLPETGKQGLVVAVAEGSQIQVYNLNIPRISSGRFQKSIQRLPS